MTLEANVSTTDTVQTINLDAQESFNYIMELIEQGVTFTAADRTSTGLALTVEARRNPDVPGRFNFPALAVAHDAALSRIVGEAIVAALRLNVGPRRRFTPR